MKLIVPSSVRSDSSSAVPLNTCLKPLMESQFNQLISHVQTNWPQEKSIKITLNNAKIIISVLLNFF